MGGQQDSRRTVYDCWREWTSVQPVLPAERVPAPTAGTAFFPGGIGLWKPDRDIQTQSEAALCRPLMVIAHNFGPLDYQESCMVSGEDVDDSRGTWPNLRTLLRGRESQCFYTNVFVGLLPRGAKFKGEFPGCDDTAFVKHCAEVLRAQLEVVKPRALVVLGLDAAGFMARAFAQFAPWIGPRGGYKSLTTIDAQNFSLIESMQIASLEHPLVAALVYHPCEQRNQHRRRYDGLVGHEAEMRLVDLAFEAAL